MRTWFAEYKKQISTVMDREKYLFILICILAFLFLIFNFHLTYVEAQEKPSVTIGEKLYKWYCAHCHGDKGDGNGFNAKNLDPRPAVHINAEFMSKRTDKDLYDVISGGGRAVGKSALMPPWGDTFSKTQIESLVLYLRKLCKCEGE